MVKRKPVRTRGKLQLSKYFQELKEGETVSVVTERSVSKNFPSTLQGRTGKVVGTRGRSCIVEINDNQKPKQHIIAPIHLKKIKDSK